MLTLGIDPALEGAIVLQSKKGFIMHVWSWKRCKRNKKPAFKITHTEKKDGDLIINTEIRRSIGGIAAYIAPSITETVQIACEQAFSAVQDLSHISNPLHRRIKQTANLRSGLSVAETGGGLVESFNALLGDRVSIVRYTMATQWRSKTIGTKPRTRREQCKIESLRKIPLRCPSINPHIRVHGQLDHITDACGVAEWMRACGGAL